MKVGILTFQYADNYGAILQAYALKNTIEKQGNSDVEIINYVKKNCKEAYDISPFSTKNPKSFLKRMLLFPRKYTQRKKFENFRKEHLGFGGKPSESINSDKYDFVVVGSDQVWSSPITGSDLNYYVPNITADSKNHKISYAASANDGFPEKEKKNEIGKYLSDFKAISVREEQLKATMINSFGIDAEVVCDPVFLRTREEWSTISVKPKGIPEKYILVYMLAVNPRLDDVAKRLNVEKGLPIFTIHPTCKRMSKVGKLCSNVGPMEFIWMIKNASYIVTNSFHGLAFSTIYSKDVYFARPSGVSNRITSLVERLDINAAECMDNIMYAELGCYGTELYREYVNNSISYIRKNL